LNLLFSDDAEEGDDTCENKQPDNQGEADDRAFVEFVLTIRQPAKLMKKIADRHRKLADQLAEHQPAQDDPAAKPEVGGKERRPTPREKIISSITLERIVISGDAATASVKSSAQAESHVISIPDSVDFRRVKNRWYCHIDPR
jgi:hypothetical protein